MLAAGARHMCALTQYDVSCWGKNDEGQLGDDTTTDRPKPVTVHFRK